MALIFSQKCPPSFLFSLTEHVDLDGVPGGLSGPVGSLADVVSGVLAGHVLVDDLVALHEHAAVGHALALERTGIEGHLRREMNEIWVRTQYSNAISKKQKKTNYGESDPAAKSYLETLYDVHLMIFHHVRIKMHQD